MVCTAAVVIIDRSRSLLCLYSQTTICIGLLDVAYDQSLLFENAVLVSFLSGLLTKDVKLMVRHGVV